MASGDEQQLFDEIAFVARSLTDEDRSPEPPPPGVWDGIELAAFGGATAGDARVDEGAVDPTDGVASVTSLSSRRRWQVAGGALAAAAVVALVLGLWAASDAGETVVGRAELAAIEDRGVGSAELVESDGALRLRIETADVEADDGEYLELWLIDETVTGLVSLGPVGADGLYDLPDGIDPAAFPVVDISTEAYDGDPTHGGRSIVRGQLELA